MVLACMAGELKQRGVMHRMVWVADRPVPITRRPLLLAYTALRQQHHAVRVGCQLLLYST